MFKDKYDMAEDIKSKIINKLAFPKINLMYENFDSLGTTLEIAIYDCVRNAICLAVDEMIEADFYTQEDFEKDVGLK